VFHMKVKLTVVAVLGIGSSLIAQSSDRPLVPSPPRVVPSGPQEPVVLIREYRELIPGLLDALGDSESEVRQYAALALAGLGEEVIPHLSRALDDPNNLRRSAAAYALGQMGLAAHTAIPSLLRRLRDDDPAVRRAAAEALSRVTTANRGFEVPVVRVPPVGVPQGGASAPALPVIAVPRPAVVPPKPKEKVPPPPDDRR
jgi:hypothetical protein